MSKRLRPLLAFLLLLLPRLAGASSGFVMTHNGLLLDGNDRPLTNPALPITLRIWDRSVTVEGQVLAWEATCNVKVQDGYYAVTLGGDCGVPLTAAVLPLDSARWLELSVGGATMTPRLRIGTVPTAALATSALDANTVGGLLPSAFARAVHAHEASEVDGLSPVATSGLYADLAGTPSLAAVATSGSYADLANQPTLGALAAKGSIADADVAPGAAIAATKIAGLANVAKSGAWADLQGVPATFTPSTHAHAAADVTGFGAAAVAAVIGSQTSGKWCTSNGTKVNCTSDAPSSTGAQASAGTAPAVACSGSTTGTFWYDTNASAVKVCNGAVYVTVSSVTAPPGAPGAPGVTPANGSLSVSWTAVSGAASYQVGWAVGTSLGASPTLVDVSSGTSTTIGGLANGTTYAVAVRSVSGTYQSSWSGITTAAPTGTPPVGGHLFDTPGTRSWVCPPGVTSVSVVAIGSGYGGNGGTGGAGGGLAWVNNIAVTPGTSYPVVVSAVSVGNSGVAAGNSTFNGTSVVASSATSATNAGRAMTGSGGTGGTSGTWMGGGGAGGYSGNGGQSGNYSGINPTSGTGGAGGGGGANFINNSSGGGGGGVGVYGEGASGAAGAGPWGASYGGAGGAGGGGSGGGSGGAGAINTAGGHGGGYGGGGAGGYYYQSTSTQYAGGNGASGAVRIVWGTNRSFPATNVGQNYGGVTESRN